MLVYGKNVAYEILQNNIKVKKLYLQENFADKKLLSLIEKSNINPKFLSKKSMDDLIAGLHQGIILDIENYKYLELNNVLKDKSIKTIVILDHIEDPHNFGAIIRTCEAAGIDAIIIPKNRQVEVNSTVIKTSVGTVFNMKIISVSNISNAIDKLKKENFWIIGTDMSAETDYKEINYDGKIALIIGNEGKGISPLIKEKCDFMAKIPMYGTTNSLNASVAAGIMIYEVVRNRK